MNLVDCYVTKVLSQPYQLEFSDVHWFVDVEYDSWGCVSTTEIMLTSFEEACKVTVGYKFLA